VAVKYWKALVKADGEEQAGEIVRGKGNAELRLALVFAR
jgi:hypothetical protein